MSTAEPHPPQEPTPVAAAAVIDSLRLPPPVPIHPPGDPASSTNRKCWPDAVGDGPKHLGLTPDTTRQQRYWRGGLHRRITFAVTGFEKSGWWAPRVRIDGLRVGFGTGVRAGGGHRGRH